MNSSGMPSMAGRKPNAPSYTPKLERNHTTMVDAKMMVNAFLM